MTQALKIDLLLRGQLIRSFSFTSPCVTVGRDPRSRLYIDNPSVSREHARISVSELGAVVEDLGSANGTFVNDELVTRTLVGENDLVHIGKFSLRIATLDLAVQRGGEQTVALRDDELARVMAANRSGSSPPRSAPVAADPSSVHLVAATVVASSIGAVVGALAMWVAVH